MKDVAANYTKYKLPLETMYSDIDYMDRYRDFTIDPINYAGLGDFVNDLHSKNQHYIPIIDAGIAIRSDNEAYTDGINRDVFIKNWDNQTVYAGQVWPGDTAFPDFLNPEASNYWQDWLGKLYD